LKNIFIKIKLLYFYKLTSILIFFSIFKLVLNLKLIYFFYCYFSILQYKLSKSKVVSFFMRFKVTLKKEGKDFDEVVIANNKDDAIKVALKNNPNSEVINSNWTFKI
tara:strand:+ start:265 stop:585 length:321 start_codon:yes stop_codon:yes gene_type:complete